MNINLIENKFYAPDFDTLKDNVSRLNKSDFTQSTTAKTVLYEFKKLVEGNFELIESTIKDPSLVLSLSALADKIRPYCTSENGVEDVVIAVKEMVCRSFFLQTDVMHQVFNHLPTSNLYHEPLPMGFHSPTQVDQQWHLYSENALAKGALQHKKLKHDKLQLESCSIKKKGIKTAKEAIKEVIDQNLEVADLSNFPDLTDELLLELFEHKNCRVKHLMIKSNLVTKIPKSCNKLQTLHCFECKKLKTLPEAMPQLTDLVCSGCISLPALPEYMPLLVWLECSGCIEIKKLPRMPQLTMLGCSGCIKLAAIPSLPNLETLHCYKCVLLTKLGTMLLLRELKCYDCINLRGIFKRMPLLEECDFSGCTILAKLPSKLPSVTRFHYTGCPQLTKLPGMPTSSNIICAG